MIELIALLTWSSIGITLAALLASPSQSRFEWAPIAAILGPMWLAVAADRS